MKNDKKYIYELWFDFYDGTQANLNGYQKHIKTFSNKEKAIKERDRLNNKIGYENEKPYYIKKIILDD